MLNPKVKHARRARLAGLAPVLAPFVTAVWGVRKTSQVDGSQSGSCRSGWGRCADIVRCLRWTMNRDAW